MVTPEGLQARADAFGVRVDRLPPPDGLLQPGDMYTSTSGCLKGDLVTETTADGQPIKASTGGTSPYVSILLVCLILIIAGLIAYIAVRRSRFRRAERDAFMEAELREDRSRGRL
jgi:hypothetical protein